MNGEDYPAFISVIPAIIDLDNAQALDRKKMQQKLLKMPYFCMIFAPIFRKTCVLRIV